ncbi:MAG: O-antigen ligase family protein, partial [Candidatus Parcubacteria bacterium]|nr:O-antigen ligase family protein [Candidatus Parcubacteria bacterium]
FNSERLEKICLFVITWGIYLILFVPLVVLKSSFFPFVAPKTIFFNMAVEILLFFYLLLAIYIPRYRPKINIFTISLAAFLGVLVLTSLTGINFFRSFWSTYERMTGLFTFFHLFAFYIILTSVFKKREDWEKILAASVIVGIGLSLYILTSDQASSRGGGTIGNTSFMAAYLLFDIFFAFILLLTKKDIIWRVFSAIALLLMLPVLFTSSAQGAIYSFFVGLIIIGLGYLIFSKNKILKKAALGIIIGAVILGAAIVIIKPPFAKNISDDLYSKMEPRFVVWQIGFKAWQEKPLLGWGPENYNVAFNKYFNPCLFLSKCGGEIWFDRSHNIILDTAIASGLAGLTAYFSIFAVFFWGLLRLAKKTAEPENLLLILGIGAALVSYFIQDLLVFDMINTYLVFFLSLALVNFLIMHPAQVGVSTAEEEGDYPPKNEESGKSFNPVLAGTMAILIGIVFLFGNVLPLRSGLAIVSMIQPSNTIDQAISNFKTALDSPMEKYEAREHFARNVSQAVFSIDPNSIDKESFQNALNLAEGEMEKSIKENPLDFRPYLFLGKIYGSDYYFSQDANKLLSAETILTDGIKLSPANQQGYWYLGEIKLAQSKDNEAIDLFQKAIDLEPKYPRSYWFLAMAYRATGDSVATLQKIKEAEVAGYDWQSNIDDITKVISIYYSLGDDSSLIPLIEKALTLQPQSSQLWAMLASSYANLNEYDKAREAAKRAGEIDPNLSDAIDQFIKTLPPE